MEWLLLFLIPGGLVSAIRFYTRLRWIPSLFAAAISIIIVISMGNAETSGGNYVYYLNGQQISSGWAFAGRSFGLFLLFFFIISMIYLGLGAAFNYAKENNLSLWRELTTLPQDRYIGNKLTNALILAIFLWPLGFGLFNMLSLERGRLWFVRLIVIFILALAVSIFYDINYDNFIILPLLKISALSLWVYDIADIIIWKIKCKSRIKAKL